MSKHHIRFKGTSHVLRCCILCNTNDDPKETLKSIRKVRKAKVCFEHPLKALWAHVDRIATATPAVGDAPGTDAGAPDLMVLRGRVTPEEDDILRQIEVLKWMNSVNLSGLLDNLHRDEQKRQQAEAHKVSAMILTQGHPIEVGNRTEQWSGPEKSAVYMARELERITGSKEPSATVESDSSDEGPDWPKVVYAKNVAVPEPQRLENTVEMLRYHGITVKYNVVKGQQEIHVPILGGTCTDTKNNTALAHVHELAANYRLRPTEAMIQRHLLMTQEVYSPVADWIRSVEWDGTSRLYHLLETVRIDQGKINIGQDFDHITMIVRKWLTTAVKAALLPLDPKGGLGVSAQGMLVFVGPQGAGKTRWFRALLPSDTDWFAEAVRLDPDNKDSVAAATGSWLVELGELDATFRKADLAALKGFLTNPVDLYRSPYERQTEAHPRRTVYCGTVNDPRFLRDETGNRRFWTIPVTSCDPDALSRVNIQQLWAEAASWLAAGEAHWLPPETEQWLSQWNQQYEDTPPVVESFASIWEASVGGAVANNEIRESLPSSLGILGRRDVQSITSYMRRVWVIAPSRDKHGTLWPIRRKVQGGQVALDDNVIDIFTSIGKDGT